MKSANGQLVLILLCSVECREGARMGVDRVFEGSSIYICPLKVVGFSASSRGYYGDLITHHH